MNGKEQKARGLAYEKMQKQLDELSIEIHNAWEVEVEERQKATILMGQNLAMEKNHMLDLFAKMLDEETQFRKAHIERSQQEILNFAAHKHHELALALMSFTRLNWWSRWGWVLFGTNWLIWTASAPVKAIYAQRTAEQKARQEAGKAPVMSQEQLRKQHSYSERPQ